MWQASHILDGSVKLIDSIKMNALLTTLNTAPLFLESRLGRPVIQMGRYRYNKHISSVGHRALWYCTREATFLTSRLGTPVIQIGQYRYNRRSTCKGSKVRWYCTKQNSRKCTAALLTIDDVIVKQRPQVFRTRRGNPVIQMGRYRYSMSNCCKPPRMRWYCIKQASKKCPEPQVFTTKRGNPVIQMGKYRYNMTNGCKPPRIRWYCIKQASKKCQGALITVDNEIIKQKPHNH
ncbi:hypothetical protein EVAR_17932_1 [Eumeta japonica]|uniref:FLYWCH-type domain-containing protein n=1 Tax=Eumeta variegata TaxID=151549 RepID=A0A4C1UY69_EUMVA|nr:hypothetical protein EVAR_17932_1 [Eumeta japonica]